MNPASLFAAAIALARQFPVGSYVWNRASGLRGLVQGYVVHSDGSARVQVEWANHTNFDYCHAVALAREPVIFPEDGEDWKVAQP